ncbi:hypothetical protein K469DRAFT_694264 [Zopfia rhizophila CBS 207.26]|uniref:Uncharacterized protein n=1 Tax=Zopfia rhizophila CBS 207.26 TaxID=1314779 RepID=A0A6A6EPU6_9PEZI|nr:hypothetical protein K469DRAFT_694264 [Zopfia rhizophila CBS 207.26]
MAPQAMVSLALPRVLNKTVNGVFTFSKDILVAATSDDVKVTALAAVESLGATLTICDQAEIRVEEFNVWLLRLPSRTGSTSRLPVAKATRQMLKEASSKNEVLPTLGQLQTLYKVLEHKITGLSFADEVMEWRLRMVDIMRTPRVANELTLLGAFGNHLATHILKATQYPTPEAIATLAGAFRNLHFLGHA